jgi:O-antigen/teichoic acid export membrane protein
MSSLVLQALYLAGLALVVLVLREEVARQFKAPGLAELLAWLPVLLALAAIHVTASRVCWGQEDFGTVLGLDLIFTVSFVGLVWGLSRAEVGLSAALVVRIYVAARAISAVAALAVLATRVRLALPARGLVTSLWRFARTLTLNSLGVFGYSRADVAIVGLFLAPAMVAAYSAGSVVYYLFMLIGDTMNMLVLPRAAQFRSRPDNTDHRLTRRMFALASVAFVGLSLPFTLVLLFFSKPLAQWLYAGQYPEVPLLFVIFAFWGISVPITRSAASILNGSGLPHLNARMTWLMAALNLVLDVALVLVGGLYGVAVGSLLVMLASVAGYWWTMRRHFGVRLSDFAFWRMLPPAPST